MKGYYRKIHISRTAAVIIAICVAAIVIMIIAICYAGGFVDSGPDKTNPSIAQRDAVTGAEKDNRAIPVTREGKINKDISEMSLDEVWMNDPREKTEVKALYISDKTIGNSDLFNELTRLCSETEINALAINVKNDYGEVTSDIGIQTADEIGAVSTYIENLPNLVSRLKESGIYTIARISTFKDTMLAKGKPELACSNTDGTRYIDGSGYSWINPYKRESWDYFIDIAKKCADIGFDEIQFDQLRVPTGIGYQDIDYGSEASGTSKTDIIAEFMEYAYRNLVNSGAFISATVNGACVLHESDGELIGQDYKKIAKWTDYICPMCYPSDYNPGEYGIENPDASPYDFTRKLLADSASKIKSASSSGHVAQVRPWLQGYSADWIEGYTPYEAQQYRDQIKAAYDSGCTQWAFWCSSGMYSKDAFRTTNK